MRIGTTKVLVYTDREEKEMTMEKSSKQLAFITKENLHKALGGIYGLDTEKGSSMVDVSTTFQCVVLGTMGTSWVVSIDIDSEKDSKEVQERIILADYFSYSLTSNCPYLRPLVRS
jgi:hypothetical protein